MNSLVKVKKTEKHKAAVHWWQDEMLQPKEDILDMILVYSGLKQVIVSVVKHKCL